jgi:hypothetical protein
MVATAGLSCLLLGVGMAAATLPDSVPGICVAVVACVPADIALLVSTNDIVQRIAPEPLLGRYNGMWGTTIAGASVLAPVLTSWSITHGGAVRDAFTLFTVGLVGALFAIQLARSLRRANRPHLAPLPTVTAPNIAPIDREVELRRDLHMPCSSRCGLVTWMACSAAAPNPVTTGEAYGWSEPWTITSMPSTRIVASTARGP